MDDGVRNLDDHRNTYGYCIEYQLDIYFVIRVFRI